ncbi:hypothetical protein [Streptomyces galilaeus]|uniref:hypothetical protein n=1 Tax=Streptomyces galilaeus TaxID=33899 RepID=UPI0038F6470C
MDATRRQLEQDRRQQAARVGYWDQPEAATASDPMVSDPVVLVNRSLDPVTRIDLWFYAPDAGIDPSKYEWIYMGIYAIPPCTRLLFSSRTIDDYLLKFGISPAGAPLRGVQFFDSDGRQWLRDPEGLRAPAHERDDNDGEELGVVPAKQEPAEHCDK